MLVEAAARGRRQRAASGSPLTDVVLRSQLIVSLKGYAEGQPARTS